MKYLIIIGVVLFVGYNFISGGSELTIIDDLKTMIPAVPSWLADIV